MRRTLLLVLSLLLVMPFGLAARAELAVAANDGKQILKGDGVGRTPDRISVLDLSPAVPRVLGSVAAPASMIGSPNAVLVSRDEKFAIVTASQKYDPADPMTPAADDKVSVIGLDDPAKPRLLQTVQAGPLASGAAMNPAQTLLLVAAKGDDAIFVFTLANRRLTSAGRVHLGRNAAPTDIVFAPDGRKAYAVAWGVTKIMELAVDGTRVTRTGRDVATGNDPYGAVVTRDGAFLINTNVSGALHATGPKIGTLSVVNLKSMTLASSLAAGKVTEHVALSPDGKHVALVLANGAATVKSDPDYGKVLGILRIYAIGNGTLKPVAQADTCHWAQGAAWRGDGELLLQQCATEREVQGYRFDGKRLVRDPAVTLPFQSRPGAIATRNSR